MFDSQSCENVLNLPDENEQRYICGKEPDKLRMAGWHSKFRTNMYSIHWSGLFDPMF